MTEHAEPTPDATASQESNHNFTSIPTLDLSLADIPGEKPLLLSQLRHALTDVGFLYVINHGVPPTVIRELIALLPVLFSLPAEEKDKVALRNSPHFLGYSADGSETTAGKQDRREQFEFTTELEPAWDGEEGSSSRTPLWERLRGPNQWPEIPGSDLRGVVKRYIHELTLLGERFLRLLAEALELPSHAFFGFLSDQHRLKLARYPAPDLRDDDGQPLQGVGPHKDSSGWWTFLLQASPPHVKGLQALNKAGEWVDVPVVEGSFVVNIGQAFEVVTNGVCKATTHRVVLTEDHERFSVPFFQGVRMDLTREEAVDALKEHFQKWNRENGGGESSEGSGIDSAFLKGKYGTWGESQVRTKIRSHQDVGRRFYADVFDKYVRDD